MSFDSNRPSNFWAFFAIFACVLTLSFTTFYFATRLSRIQFKGEMVGEKIRQHFVLRLQPFNEYFSYVFNVKYENTETSLDYNQISVLTSEVASDVYIDQLVDPSIGQSTEQSPVASANKYDPNETQTFKRYFNFAQVQNGFFLTSLAENPQRQLPLFKAYVQEFTGRLESKVEKRMGIALASARRLLDVRETVIRTILKEPHKTTPHLLGVPHDVEPIRFDRATLFADLETLGELRRNLDRLNFDPKVIGQIMRDIPLTVENTRAFGWREVAQALLASILIFSFLLPFRRYFAGF